MSISDGDTISVMHDGHAEKIRLSGIDAPEKEQAFGQRARNFIASLCADKIVTVNTTEKDRFGRSIGVVILADGKILNEEIVSCGLAWWFRKYAAKDTRLKELEESARKERRGLWIDDNPTAPWDFRRSGRSDGKAKE